MDCEQVDSEGKVLKKAVLPKDSFVLLVPTDGETWMDMQVVDGSKVIRSDYEDWSTIYSEETLEFDEKETIYRIPVDRSGFPGRVNGVQEEQVFAGIMYAG